MLGAHDVIGYSLLEECGPDSALHRPGVPLEVQLGEIHQAGRPESHSVEFRLWCACTCVIPRADDQIVFGARLRRGVLHVLAVEGERTRLVIVIAAGDGQYGKLHPGILIVRGIVSSPVIIAMWMRDPFMECG